jgi:glycosyltransferase involved in cell wall biosynthesis
MRLLYITNGITGSGGLERVLSLKASHLADNFDYEVIILTLNEDGVKPFFNFSEKIKHITIKVNGNPLNYIYQYISQIQKFVFQINPDVISVCDDGLKGFFIPIILKKKFPIIYERHVSKIIELGENPNKIKKFITNIKFSLMNQLGKTFNKFIVLTEDNQKEWKLNNLEVIANPLSFYPEASATLNEKIVLAVGKQSYQKGYDRLLESWKIVQEKHPDWQLHIYGKLHPEKIFDKIAEKLKINNSVCFFPPQENIQDIYLNSSIYVMSSRFEGFGMVLIEAMACGVPCISFNCPYGPANIITNNEDGYIVKNNDIEQFAEKIEELINNEAKRIQFGIQAKENVKKYDLNTILKKWDNLFKKVTLNGK